MMYVGVELILYQKMGNFIPPKLGKTKPPLKNAEVLCSSPNEIQK